MQEVGSGNMSQKSDEEDFVKVEDLPMQLSVICEVGLARMTPFPPLSIHPLPLFLFLQTLIIGLVKSNHLCVCDEQEALQKRIVEEQQNNNLSAEILNGNTDTSGLVGNGHTLKEPGRYIQYLVK